MGVLVKNGKSYTGTGDLLIQPVIYSDDERCIGVWRDGKPLYKKTIHINSLPSSVGTETLYPHNISNIDTICDFTATVRWSDGGVANSTRVMLTNRSTNDSVLVQGCWQVQCTKTDIIICVGYDRSSMNADCTIQYTKTTDTAGTAAWVPTGATPIHYSLNEQVIGTWIDGKPLYRITVDAGRNVSINNSSWVSVINPWIENVKAIIDSSAYNFSDSGCSNVAAIFDYNKSTRELRALGQNGANNFRYANIEYTKTTD